MKKIAHEKLELDVDDLLLDLENPRTGSVASQADALAAIVKLSSTNFRNMMKSIKEHGLDPGDAFYLIQDDPDEVSYTVVDGNRRLAALKVLRNPLLLKGTTLSDSVVRPLTKEAEGFTLDRDFTVDCVLFDSREEAGDWIERRHGRGMDGEGRIPWGSLDSQRFQKDHTILDVIEFVGKNSTFSNEDWARIKGAVEKNSSSLKRFLESKAGKQYLGFGVPKKGDGPTFTQDDNYVIDTLSKIFSDIAAGEINTRSYNKAADIEEYFSDLEGQVSPRAKKAGQPKDFSSTIVGGSKKARPRQAATPATVTPPAKTKKVPPPRVTLAPVRLSFAAPDGEKGKQLFREAAKLRIKETPLASAFCFRAIIEFSVDTYMRANNLPPTVNGTDLQLSTRVEHVIQHIYKNSRAPKGDLNPIKATLTSKTAAMSVAALNGYIHSKFQMPTADDIRVSWENAVPLFLAIYGPAK